jgi:hypothetical protein
MKGGCVEALQKKWLLCNRKYDFHLTLFTSQIIFIYCFFFKKLT